MEKKCSLLKGMVVLFQFAGIILAFLLMLLGLLGFVVGLSEQPSLALMSLFCLSILTIISISAWRMLAAARQLADDLPLLPRYALRVLPLLDRCTKCCIIAALAWLAIPLFLMLPQGELNDFVLPPLWLILLALSFHLPAASLRRTLPLAHREALPFPAGRILLGVTALITCVLTLWSFFLTVPTPSEWVLLAVFGLCCLCLALFALQLHPRMLRLSGWGLILLGALLCLNYLPFSATTGIVSPLALVLLLAFACIPAAIGLWLTVLSDLISL